jgi:hypothetical protein
MTDFNELIPEMRDWNNGAGIDVESWIACQGNFRLAIGYSNIFWPEFVEFDKYVLRAGFAVESLRDFERQCGGDRRQIEGVMNHLHIADIQYHGCEDLTQERVIYLGRVLRDIHRAKLAWQFPSKSFEVHFDDSPLEHITDYQVSFVQV